MKPHVAIVGAGPAGLMAAEVISAAGFSVSVYERMPSVGRKFLMAGKGGLNLTHAESFERFLHRYGVAKKALSAPLAHFGPDALRVWAQDLGIQTFVGSSGRVFPSEMKAAPLLRAWLHRLRTRGVRIHVRHRWLGWSEKSTLRFETPEKEIAVHADAVVLALGGASWPELGSDGRWYNYLQTQGISLHPFLPANCGFDVGWSPYFSARFAGHALKNVVIHFCDATSQHGQQRGECVVTDTGLEGGLIYALSAPLRDTILETGAAKIALDFLPDWPFDQVLQVLQERGRRSWTSFIESRLKLKPVHCALIREVLSSQQIQDSAELARCLKSCPLTLRATRPLAEAISTAGGVDFENLDERFMLKAFPGLFCAGEMLNWEAPTGGYLLTASFATGRWVGEGVVQWLNTLEKSGSQISIL